MFFVEVFTMNHLCIDFGSTFVKFSVLSEGNVIFKDKHNFPEPCMNNGVAYEVDIRKIGSIIFEILKKTEGYRVKKCFIAVQMHGYVLRDKKGAFSNYISWKDKSGDITNPNLSKINFWKNGTSLKNNLPAVKLIEKDLDGAEFFTLGSYIAYLLTGINKTHKTDACASGFFDAETLIPISVCKNLTLPKVADKMLPIGEYNGIEIYTPCGDHQLSFLGSGAEAEAYLLNIGTATQISTLGSGCENSAVCEQRPYFTKDRLLTISGLTGGEALFQGYPMTVFCEEIRESIKKLPPKKKVLVGGGGAATVFDQLKLYLEMYHIRCEKVEKNISEEGFKKMTERNNMEIGTMLSEVCFPNFPVILKNENMDFLIIDNEHGAFDYGFFSAIVMNARLVGLPIIVRLPDNNRKDIIKLVDMGVTGFLLPMTNTAEDIKKVVEYAKYVPIGKRGISTSRAHTFYNPPPINEYMKVANETVKVYAQIETLEGIENLEQILSVIGVDGIFVGPNDLSCDLGCIGNNEPVKKALIEIALQAEKKNKPWGIITTDKDLIDCALQNGVNYISYGSEINMLKNAARKIRSTVLV